MDPNPAIGQGHPELVRTIALNQWESETGGDVHHARMQAEPLVPCRQAQYGQSLVHAQAPRPHHLPAGSQLQMLKLRRRQAGALGHRIRIRASGTDPCDIYPWRFRLLQQP